VTRTAGAAAPAADHGTSAAVDIIIVSFNTRELLRACLESIARHANEASVQTVVVDNGSGDGSVELVTQEFGWVRLVAVGENLGFGAANNRGIACGQGEYLLFLNSDAELTAGAVDALRECLKCSRLNVIAGPNLFFPDGSFQPSCRRFPTLLRNLWGMSGIQARFPGIVAWLDNWLTEPAHLAGARVDMVSGACFMARRDYMQRIGGFDENLFLYEEEIDVMYPARRAGESVVFCPAAKVMHHRGGSTEPGVMSSFSARHMYRSKYYAFRKHYGRLRARLAFMTDAAILGVSVFHHRLRRKATPASMHLAMCRRGWRESFVPAQELRSRPDFFSR
jgi:GT2 family glycosyltransferase